MITVRDLPLSLIDVPADRVREVDPVWVEALAGMIEAQGLVQPIRVRPGKVEGRFRLVAGLQRLEAHRRLERATIAATVSGTGSDDEARLEEVMENLGRSELIALDRCHALHELKAVHERLYPQARHGGDRRSISAQDAVSDEKTLENESSSGQVGHLNPEEVRQVFGFHREIAEKVGLSDRTIRRCAQIWDDLSSDSRRRLVGSDLANNQSELQLLSQQKPGTQKRILDLILDDTTPVDGVRVALDFLEKGRLESTQERKFTLFAGQFAKLSETRLDQLAELHADRMIAALKRLGRI